MTERYTKQMYKADVLKYIDENGYDPITMADFISTKCHGGEYIIEDLELWNMMLQATVMDMDEAYELTKEEFLKTLDKI